MKKNLQIENHRTTPISAGKKLFILALLSSLSLHSASISAQYDISFSFFGKIGESRVSFEHDNRFYHISADAGLIGTLAAMANHRRETHESFGTIKNGVLVPDLYKKVKQTDHRYEETYYVFNHANQSIQKFRFREKNIYESHFDFKSMENVEEMHVKKRSSVETLPYYAKNDLLSLFFNIRTILNEIPQGSEKIEHTAGTRNDTGEVVVTNPAGKKREELAQLMPDNEDRLITVIVDQEIFKSGEGELYLNLDKDHLAKEAMLKDVMLFGDIRGKRVSQKGSL